MKNNITVTDALILDTRFGTHGNTYLKSGDIEMFIKLNALFCRGVIIPDSDLNNNPVLHALLKVDQSDSTFKSALELGFIRPAVRYKAGKIWSQMEILEALKKKSPERGHQVPVEYVQKLDGILSRREKMKDPLVWSTEGAAKIFAERILNELPYRCNGLSGIGQEKLQKILEFVKDNKEQPNFDAVSIEKNCFSESKDQDDKQLWNGISQCYLGNIGIELATSSDGKVITAMPEQSKEEHSVFNCILPAKAVEQLKLLEHQIGEEDKAKNEMGNYLLNLNKLRKLTLDQIIELREASYPDSYIQARYNNMLPSFKDKESNNLELSLSDTRQEKLLQEARQQYWENLFQQGLALDKKKHEEPIVQYCKEKTGKKNRYDGAKLFFSMIPIANWCVTACGLFEWMHGLHQYQNNSFDEVPKLDDLFLQIPKMPDYGLIEKI
ncbi:MULTISPECIES: hypothetical protein [Cyanophyceae]|uniref:hypothetical protein n=1 Tax=Cyanophyceae TaxID=3028117 RepID=UPI00016DC546|nr:MULTISPECIES: hypothetical protein [Cyanophyceae]ACA98031.1 hypothetical protein SYNPCC7002_A0013 [Picosynechococcus sp. PCC 7002]SMH42335.1 hypothetical protein SAMN06272755_1291 [Picosynechococcus sp. OG1]SMQ78739.1 hypothetical protein SAMN06272774_0573 [Synechococcus sp. 7002]